MSFVSWHQSCHTPAAIHQSKAWTGPSLDSWAFNDAWEKDRLKASSHHIFLTIFQLVVLLDALFYNNQFLELIPFTIGLPGYWKLMAGGKQPASGRQTQKLWIEWEQLLEEKSGTEYELFWKMIQAMPGFKSFSSMLFMNIEYIRKVA